MIENAFDIWIRCLISSNVLPAPVGREVLKESVNPSFSLGHYQMIVRFLIEREKFEISSDDPFENFLSEKSKYVFEADSELVEWCQTQTKMWEILLASSDVIDDSVKISVLMSSIKNCPLILDSEKKGCIEGLEAWSSLMKRSERVDTTNCVINGVKQEIDDTSTDFHNAMLPSFLSKKSERQESMQTPSYVSLRIDIQRNKKGFQNYLGEGGYSLGYGTIRSYVSGLNFIDQNFAVACQDVLGGSLWAAKDGESVNLLLNMLKDEKYRLPSGKTFSEINIDKHNLLTAALKKFIDFLINKANG